MTLPLIACMVLCSAAVSLIMVFEAKRSKEAEKNTTQLRQLQSYIEYAVQRQEQLHETTEADVQGDIGVLAQQSGSALQLTEASKNTTNDNGYKSRRQQGTRFEDDICELLKSNPLSENQRILRHVMLPDSHIGDIDILLIDTSGIYIIECKNWRGYIVGDVNWEEWIQIKPYSVNDEGEPHFCHNSISRVLSNEAKAFKNPYRQVDKQWAALEAFIRDKISITKIYKRIVVFSDDTNFDFLRGNDEHKYKCEQDSESRYEKWFWHGKKEELIDTVKKLQKESGSKILSEEEINDIHKELKPLAAPEIQA